MEAFAVTDSDYTACVAVHIGLDPDLRGQDMYWTRMCRYYNSVGIPPLIAAKQIKLVLLEQSLQ